MRRKDICLFAYCAVSLVHFSEYLHLITLLFIQLDCNTLYKNYYIGKVSFEAFLGSLKYLKNDDMKCQVAVIKQWGKLWLHCGFTLAAVLEV